MKNYKVYLIRDKQNQIKYAGLTSQDLNKRFWQHCVRRRISSSEFKIELVQDYMTLENAVILEEMLINQYRLRDNGWNVAPQSVNGYSNRHPQWLKDKWSKERPGVAVSPEHAAKNRVARLGKRNSADHNRRISEVVSKPVMCLETGVVYCSAKAAATALGLHRSKISNVCHGKRPTTGGLHFIFL